MKFSRLFAPGNIGTLTLKNRLIMPPMVLNYADDNGLVTKRYVDHIERVARGGVGAIVLEASFIRQDGKGFKNQLGIHTDATIPGLKKLTVAAHRHGVAIGSQLYHGGRQASSHTAGTQPLAPSAIPDPTINEVPKSLTHKQIKEIIGDYAAAALRAKKAGMDFVEIHGAHGYLITQFLSPFSNKRTDGYGKGFQGRLKFLLEVVVAVRAAVGADFPVTVRLSGDEMVPGGITLNDTKKIAVALEKAGVNALHISAGNYASYARGYMISPMAHDDGVLLHLARGVKSVVSIPVIAVGKLRTPKIAEKTLTSGTADFVAIGRTLLADPDWPRKVQEGAVADIMPCIACNQGCISRLFAQQDVWCTVNPEAGRESLFAKPRKGVKRNVFIVGGGPAGMAAAIVAARRGHEAVLYEKSRRLGGQLWAAAETPHRQGWKELRQKLIRDVNYYGVKVKLNTELTIDEARREKPDAVIVAMGSSAMSPKIPGVGRTQVMVARDVLERRAQVKGRVVIAGGGCMGAQTAEYLAVKGHPVTVVEMQAAIATDAPVDDRALLLARLKKLGVRVLTETKIMSIGSRSVVIEDHQGTRTVMADSVVLCLGGYPNDGLTAELKTITKKVMTVGDAKDPRRVTDAMLEGSLAALAV